MIEKSNKIQGSISSERKYKSLNARWMKKPSETTIMLENELTIISANVLKRNAIVKLPLTDKGNDEGYFRVLGVYTKFYNKLYINPNPKTKKDYQFITWSNNFAKGKIKISTRMIYFGIEGQCVNDVIPTSITEAELMFRVVDASCIRSFVGIINT